jgi:O-antigen/teichoic acid export membrane protein
MSSYKKFTKNVALISVVNLLIALKGIIFVPLITKLLGAFNYGIWVQISVTITLLAPLIRLGLTNSLIRYLAAEKDTDTIKEGIYSVIFLISIIAFASTLFFIIFIIPVSNFFQTPIILVALLPIIILFECLNGVFFAVFQAFQRMLRYSFLTIIASLGEIIFVVLSILLGYGIYGAVLSLLIIRLIVSIISSAFIYKKFGFKIPDFHFIKKYLLFGLPTLLSGFSYSIVTSADKYLVGFFLGTLFVGYYAPAYSLGNIITFLILPLSFVLFPAVCKSYDENELDEVKNKLKYSLKYFLIIAIPAVFGLSALVKEILQIFSTQEIATYSYFVTPFVATSTLFYGLSDIFSQIIILAKKTKIVGYIWFAAAIINIILNLILIPLYGILGAAISTLLCYLLAFLLIYFYSTKEFIFEIDWPSILKSLFASFLMAIIILIFNPTNLFSTIFLVFMGAIIYAVIMIFIKGFTKKEIIFLKELIRPNKLS